MNKEYAPFFPSYMQDVCGQIVYVHTLLYLMTLLSTNSCFSYYSAKL